MAKTREYKLYSESEIKTDEKGDLVSITINRVPYTVRRLISKNPGEKYFGCFQSEEGLYELQHPKGLIKIAFIDDVTIKGRREFHVKGMGKNAEKASKQKEANSRYALKLVDYILGRSSEQP